MSRKTCTANDEPLTKKDLANYFYSKKFSQDDLFQHINGWFAKKKREKGLTYHHAADEAARMFGLIFGLEKDSAFLQVLKDLVTAVAYLEIDSAVSKAGSLIGESLHLSYLGDNFFDNKPVPEMTKAKLKKINRRIEIEYRKQEKEFETRKQVKS